MPQFWIAIFFILLAVAELYQSIKDIDLPLPIYLGLGTILAVASNYQQQLPFAPFLHRRGSANAQRSAGKETLLLEQTLSYRQQDRQITHLPTIAADPVVNPIHTPLLVTVQPQDLD
jgi:hypothetical protein